MKPSYERPLTRGAAHNCAGDNKPLYLDHAFRGVSRRSTQWIRKAGFTLSKLCTVSVRDLPIKNRTTGWPRPKNGRGSDNLANSGRVALASHQDLRKKENEPLSALPGRLRGNLLVRPMIEKAAFVWSVNDAWAMLAAFALLGVLVVPFAWRTKQASAVAIKAN
jgi:hypothetical protein